MSDMETVVNGLAHCRQYGTLCGHDCEGVYAYTEDGRNIIKVGEHRHDCPYGKCKTGCVVTLVDDAVKLIKEQEDTIRGLEEKLRVLEYGDQDAANGYLTPAV